MDPEAFTASSIITMVCIDMSFYKRALYLMSNNHMKTCITLQFLCFPSSVHSLKMRLLSMLKNECSSVTKHLNFAT